jgi:hypothetical protein
MALNFADRLVSNNPSAYGIVRAIEVSGHKTVSSLSALYKIPDCILSDTGDNSGNDSLGQLWYVIDAKEVYQLVNWEKRNEAGGWKPYLSGVITDEALEEILKTKQDKLIAGEGISISEDNVISCTIDTSLFRMVDELPSLEEAETNKIYLLRKENNIGELQSYTEYIVTIKVDEEGKEIKEWEKIGEYDLSIELAPYLKIEDAEKTYVKKENIVDSFEGGDPKEQVLSAEKGKELKELVDSLEERKVDSVTATEGKGIIVEGTHNDPTIGVLRDPESEGFFTIEETGLKLSGVQDAIDEAVGELTDRVELESDVVYNINEIFPGEGKGENGDQWHIQYAAAKLDAFLPAEKKVPGIKVKFINLDGNWRTFTFNGGYFLDGRNWSYDITSNDFTELATENLPTATPESNGVMSKEDKAKLDGISETINKDVDDKIAEVKETIDNYTVNGYKISTNPSLDRNDIGLGNVTNDAQIKRSEMGVPKGVATLGEDGKVPVEQLPGQVDEVFGIDRFVSTKTDIPSSRLVIGSTYYVEDEKKIYTAISETELDEGATPDKGVIYSNRETNIIYRWDGAELVEIGNPVHLGEVDGTAYPGDKGKATTDKVNAHVADFENPHQVTKEQIGLGNVDNTSDADKPISSAVQEALDAVNKEVSEHKADKNNPHEVTKAQVGLGNVDNTADLDKPVSNATQELVDNTKKELDTKIDNHTSDFNNPHKVTKEQVGLGNVDNTADINKPVSVAQQALVDSTKAELKKDIGDIEKDVTNHIADKNNPHEVNKLQVGLGNVDNTSDINKPVSIAQQAALDKLKSDLESIIGSTGTDLSAHLKDFDNPHKVTKDQVGLGKVDNTADLEKPVSVATQESINAVQSNLDKTNISLENHIADKKNPHEVTKEQVGLGNVDNTSDLDKPVSHYQQDALDELERRLQGSIDGSGSDLSAHISDFNNPHKVTKDQVGLGNVDNTADKDKPISDATQKALDSIKTETNTIIETHIADKNNPHEVTKEQIGLGEVTNDAQVKRSEMGVAGGVATLDQEGKVPSSQLPSFVDDVIEVATLDELPATGEAGKIYVTKDTNLTYRWSGSKYVEISASLALGETSSTAYAGDKGKATTDSLNAHLADFNNPHKVDKAQVGLGNVDNTSDKDKPVSDATQQLINEVKESINSGNTTITDNLTKHIEDYNNPHKVTKDQVGLGNVDNTSDKDKPLSDAAKEAINEVKTLITSSGTDLSNHIKDYTNPHRVTAEQVGLGNVNNTSDLDKPISNATQKELDKLDAKIDKINTDQGTDLSAHLRDFSNPHKVTKEQIGLGNVDNTADLDKPISTATQKAIDDAKAANNTALDNHANRTDNPHKVTKDQVGLGNVDNTADINKPVSVAQQNALDTLSNSLNTAINNHVGNTNNPHQVTKEQVGLGKVDNTSDLEKPISVATQNAISEVVSNLDKHIADKNNPHEVTKEQIGLGRVDNTSDLEKPISTATQVALDKKAELGPDGKIPESQLPERTMHSLFYKGTWDAERNLPTLANGDKAQDGDYYLVNNDGESFGYKFMVNDIIFNASGIWYRMMGSNKRDNPTEFKITKFTADRTLLERGESTEITLEWEYQLTPSGQINFQFIDTHDIPVEERTYKITATGGQTFTLRGSYLSEVATATLTIDTADKVYVGASSNSAPTDSDFIAMNSFFSFGDNEFPFTPIDCSGGKYIYVAIPTEEYSKYRIYCNNYPVDDVTVYSRRITNIFTGYTDYTITKLANLYHGILNIEVKLIDKR